MCILSTRLRAKKTKQKASPIDEILLRSDPSWTPASYPRRPQSPPTVSEPSCQNTSRWAATRRTCKRTVIQELNKKSKTHTHSYLAKISIKITRGLGVTQKSAAVRHDSDHRGSALGPNIPLSVPLCNWLPSRVSAAGQSRQMWRLGLPVKAEEGAPGLNEEQTFLGHLMLQRWVIGPLDVHGLTSETPWVKSVLRLSLSSFTQHLYSLFGFVLFCLFVCLSTHAGSVASGTTMTTSQSKILVQMEVFWQWVNPTNFRARVH